MGIEKKPGFQPQDWHAGANLAEQQKLQTSRILLIGVGALGSETAAQLAHAGIGFLRLADRDYWRRNQWNNHSLADEHATLEEMPKAIAAEKKIRQINETIKTVPVVDDINRLNISALLSDVDLVICCSRDWETASLVNEACVQQNCGLIYGFCSASSGGCLNILPGKTACLKCVENLLLADSENSAQSPPDNANTISSLIATVLAAESTKFLTGNFDVLEKHLLLFDGLKRKWEQINIAKDNIRKNCPVCNNREFDFLTGKFGSVYFKPIAPDQVQIIPFVARQLDLAALAIKLSALGSVRANDFLVIFEIDNFELTFFPDGRALVRGTTDAALARSLYRKFAET